LFSYFLLSALTNMMLCNCCLTSSWKTSRPSWWCCIGRHCKI